MFESRTSLVAATVALIGAVFAARFLYTGYVWRKRFRTLPGPPHDPIWGHLKVMGEASAALPNNAFPVAVFIHIQKKYNLGDFFYIDVWPAANPLFVSLHPSITNQFTAGEHSTPKDPTLIDFLGPVGGPNNLVIDEGQQWKTWRKIFNPGFSLTHLMTVVPDIAAIVSTFHELLERKVVEGKVFRLEPIITRLLVTAFESQVQLFPKGVLNDPIEPIDIRRPIKQWLNSRVMDRYLGQKLDERSATRSDRKNSKATIDLAIDSFYKDKGISLEDSKKTKLDPEFRRIAIDQIKIFIFAGHDTTSGTISYALYKLGQFPAKSAMVREEIDTVFGKNADIAQSIKDDPYSINKLEYITAVIRETLRLFPPANSFRRGTETTIITDPKTGEKTCPSGVSLVAVAYGSHTAADIWQDPFEFRPERWLTDAPAPIGADREAFIPFSKLPRNCIGQEMAMLEMKIVLAIVCRDFNFTARYDELQELKNDGSGYPSLTTGMQEIFGEEAYQIARGTAKPREGLPVRVTRRKA
ncbi:hypothetical protein MBLNU457_1451t2 [Dothideomycetes sp. NU457]